ncbi:MAG: hypothetical protein U9N32_07360, partial [Spirochaetota bacterium]|nr:hypothetical protein [Spirochaetota bacterium]
MNEMKKSSIKFMKLRQKYMHKNNQTAIILLISFIIVFFSIIISSHYSTFFTQFRLTGFEEGKVAPRDILADNGYSYIDTIATEKKIENELTLIFPIFEMDNEKIKSVINYFSNFSQKYLLYKESPTKILKTDITSSFLPIFSLEEIEFLLNDVDPYIVIPQSSELIEEILHKGIFEHTDKIQYSKLTKIQLWQWERGRKIFSIVDIADLTTLEDLDKIIESKLLLKTISDIEKSAIKLMVKAFIKENVYFNEIQTQLRYDEIRKEIEPVLENINPGDYIIRKGFIVSSGDMLKAEAMSKKNKEIDIIQISAVFLFLILIYSFSILMFKPLFKGKKRKYQYIYLLNSFYIFFIMYTSIICKINFTINYNLSLFLPTALLSMMIVILIGFQESILSVIILSISLFLFPGTSIPDFLFSFVTGVSSAFLMKGVKKRIDLVKPAIFLAGINILILLLGYPKYIDINWLLFVILLAILNAFISSILNLTLIPVFEHFLNIPTVFKLMELSDMNSP